MTTILSRGQPRYETQTEHAAAPIPGDPSSDETHSPNVARPHRSDQAGYETHSTNVAAPLDRLARYPDLIAAVRQWQLLQTTRIKLQLPERAIERAGIEPPAWLTAVRELLQDQEDASAKTILGCWKHHPLRPWGLQQPGIGEHSLATLVGMLDGNPYVAYPKKRVGAKGNSRILDGEPYARTMSELWAYCGVGDAARKRERNMSQEDMLALGKPLVKARLRLMSESLLKASARTPECRAGYDRYRARFEEREDWTDGRRHASALRLVAKYDILAALYDEAKRLHVEGLWPTS